MNKLYEITEQHRSLVELAERDEIPQEALADTFESIEGSFNEKAVSVTHVIHGMDSDIELIDSEIKRLTSRKNALKNKKESVREYLRSNMEASDITKISCPLFNITLAKGREVAIIENEDEIPDDLVTVEVKTKPNKTEILKLLKAGETVKGARLERSQSSLRIK